MIEGGENRLQSGDYYQSESKRVGSILDIEGFRVLS